MLESKLFPRVMAAAGTLTGFCVFVQKKKEAQDAAAPQKVMS